jgi:EAL domain-containing protein (putative c-di-GMP-specific phosphodiesterase class I)
VFEIIESSEIDNLEATVRFIQRFKKLGVRFALDDFGSGFFSFFYLKALPVDFLKIDKSIILEAISDEKNHYIIRAITQLAENLGIKVIAEGVEDEAILNAISEYDISYIQGYHIARPQPVAEFQ